MDWIPQIENDVLFDINETPELVDRPATDFLDAVQMATWHEPLGLAAAKREQQAAAYRLQQDAEIYNKTHPHTPKKERVLLPNNLFPPLPRVGWKAILLALCSIPDRVLRWWRKLDKIDEQTFDKVPR